MTPLITSGHYYTFISSCAEIFGALVGLISLVYVYKTESMRENISRVVAEIDRRFKKASFPDDFSDSDTNLKLSQLDQSLDKVSRFFKPEDLKVLKSSVSDLQMFQVQMIKFSKSFKRSAASAFLVLFVALAGLAFPFESYPHIGQVIFGLSLILVTISSYLAARFVRELSSEEHVFHISTD